MDSQKKYPKAYSVEFFPPKSEESALRLRETCAQLAPLAPCFASVTFGAGGSTQERTFEPVREIFCVFGFVVVSLLSCIGSTIENIRRILTDYRTQGIRHLVALRGDMPSGMREAGELRYANELVEFIRAETGDHFFIEVAAYPEFHPQASSAKADLRNFKRKVEAGADAAITQYFYNVDAYFHFVGSCEQMGIDVPIVPGIMPITNYEQLARFTAASGAEIPRWIRTRLAADCGDKTSLRAIGQDLTP